MRRIGLAVLLALGLTLAPLAVGAQQTGKMPRIGVLGTPTSVEQQHLWDAFRRGLNELGYVEGQNIAFEWRSAVEKKERAQDAAELVRLNVDVIVAAASNTATAVKPLTHTIPIVMVSGDPVADGLVTSLARPGGNVTGLSTLATGVAGKQLELLKEAIPGVSRVAVLWNPDNPVHAEYLREAEAAARELRMQPHRVKAQGTKDYDGAFLAIEKVRAQALLVSGDPIFLEHRVMIAELSARKRLPAMYARREHVEAGGLIAYGTDRIDIMRRVAVYVDKILKGAKPADLPVEQPTKFEFVINMKTAKALGLTIPQTLLLRADQVIE